MIIISIKSLVNLNPSSLLNRDVVLPDHGHPDQGAGGQREGEELGEPKGHGLEDEELRGEVAKGDDVGPHGDVVDGAVVQVVGGVEADDADDEGPGAEEAAGQRGELVGSLGVVVGGDEFVDRVFGVEGGRGWG